MTFSPIKAGGFVFGERLTHTQMNQLNTDIVNALDGAAGGTYSPVSALSIANLECPTTPTGGNDVVNKTYVDTEITDAVGGFGDIGWAVYQTRNARYHSKYSPSEAANSIGVAIHANGTKLYVFESTTTDQIFQYSLSEAWDVSSATYDSVSLNVFSEEPAGVDFCFGDSGSKLYVCGASAVFQYTVATPWDLSTASYASKTTVLTESTAKGITFNGTGTIMLIADSVTATANKYTLSTAWDVSTAADTGDNLTLAGTPSSIHMNPAGTIIVSTDSAGDVLARYRLTTPGDITTGSQDTSANLSISEVGTPTGVTYSSDGSRLYICDSGAGTVWGYYSALPTLSPS